MTYDLKGAGERLRRGQCDRLAVITGVDSASLYAGAMAAWSNLNPDRVSFDHALSVAAAVLQAVGKED